MKQWNMLDMVTSANLVLMIQNEYESLNVSDKGFAAIASQRLGKDINKDHVSNRRNALGIKSHYDKHAEEARQKKAAEKAAREARTPKYFVAGTVLARLQALEEQVARHAAVIEQLA
jgi:hypothetical protein